MNQVTIAELTLIGTTSLQVNVADTHQAAHPQVTVMIYTGSDTASDVAVVGERVLNTSSFQVIEEDTFVRTYPQGIVILVVCQGSDILGLTL